MTNRRLCRALFLVMAVLPAGCETGGNDDGPTPVCVSVGGVWDVRMVGETGTGIACTDRDLVWTIRQDGCDVTIESEVWDTANGAVGQITDNRLYVAWHWLEGCYRYNEVIEVVIDGDMMTGAYYLVRGQAVYPASCPGLGMCRAALDGVRRVR